MLSPARSPEKNQKQEIVNRLTDALSIGLMLLVPPSAARAVEQLSARPGERPALSGERPEGGVAAMPLIKAVGIDLLECQQSDGRLQRLVLQYPGTSHLRIFSRQTAGWSMVTSHPSGTRAEGRWSGEIDVQPHQIHFRNGHSHEVYRLSSAIMEATVTTPDKRATNVGLLVRGEGPALIHVGARWCGPCQAQMAVLRGYAREGQLQIINLGLDEDPPSEPGMDSARLEGPAAAALGIETIPYNVLVVERRVETLPLGRPNLPEGPFGRVREVLRKLRPGR